jgi:aminoglycoside phosphotransferase (APT) family kinase protein
VELIEGGTVAVPSDLAEFAGQLATVLAAIHTVDHGGSDLSFLPDQERRFTRAVREPPATLDEALAEGRIRDALRPVWPLAQRNRSVLLHGDFWPGNTLWRDDTLVAVIDWEDAGLGDPLADLANGRAELAMLFGLEAMRHFTRRYLDLMPSVDHTNLRWWDLCAALRPAGQMSGWGLAADARRRLQEGHRAFVAELLDGAQP